MRASFIATMAWWLFIASWWAASWWVARAKTTAPRGKRIVYFLGFAIGFGALFAANHSDPHHRAGWLLWHNPAVVDALLLAGEIAAFAFAWWARVHLGRLWSGMLTLREGHKVVDTGPYRLARHPIYTGFIAASWCYALIETHPPSLVGAVVLTIVMTVKAKEEERFLRQELGAADYDAYAARTRMLLPVPK